MVGRDASPDEREFIRDPPCALPQCCLPRRHFRQAKQSNSPLVLYGRPYQKWQVLAASVLRRRGHDRFFEFIRCCRGATCLGTANPGLPGNHADRIDGDGFDQIASKTSAGRPLFCEAQFERVVATCIVESRDAVYPHEAQSAVPPGFLVKIEEAFGSILE
jgi:hypothetical protein